MRIFSRSRAKLCEPKRARRIQDRRKPIHRVLKQRMWLNKQTDLQDGQLRNGEPQIETKSKSCNQRIRTLSPSGRRSRSTTASRIRASQRPQGLAFLCVKRDRATAQKEMCFREYQIFIRRYNTQCRQRQAKERQWPPCKTFLQTARLGAPPLPKIADEYRS